MKPLVDKKYIFARILAGKPIVLDLMKVENRRRYDATKELFFETGVFEHIDPAQDEYGHDTVVRHAVHCIVPRNGMPHVMVIDRGRMWRREDQS